MASHLNRNEMIDVIEGKSSARRIPMLYHFWINPSVFLHNEKRVRELLDQYPMDAQVIQFTMPEVFTARDNDPSYRWVQKDQKSEGKAVAFDAVTALENFDELDEVLNRFPSPEYPDLFLNNQAEDGRYRLGVWWFLLFERHWSLRGMTNALVDFYEEPENVHKLYRKLTDFYLRVIERAKHECNLDGIFVSDDLGTQASPFFSPAIFREFFVPYYKEIIAKAHSLGMHFWLHSCGNIELLLQDLVDIGLDVIHPIQRYTMDETRISEKFGDKLCIWAGFDVQQTIPYGTAEEVRREVRRLIDIYYNPKGRFMLTAGNVLTGDCTLELLEALLDETVRSDQSM